MRHRRTSWRTAEPKARWRSMSDARAPERKTMRISFSAHSTRRPVSGDTANVVRSGSAAWHASCPDMAAKRHPARATASLAWAWPAAEPGRMGGVRLPGRGEDSGCIPPGVWSTSGALIFPPPHCTASCALQEPIYDVTFARPCTQARRPKGRSVLRLRALLCVGPARPRALVLPVPAGGASRGPCAPPCP